MMEFWQGCLSVGMVAICIVMLIGLFAALSDITSKAILGLVGVFGFIFLFAVAMGLGAVIQEFL